MSNPQPSCFGLLLGWVAVAWLGFGVMTITEKLRNLSKNLIRIFFWKSMKIVFKNGGSL